MNSVAWKRFQNEQQAEHLDKYQKPQPKANREKIDRVNDTLRSKVTTAGNLRGYGL
jgi:hypothetical protein